MLPWPFILAVHLDCAEAMKFVRMVCANFPSSLQGAIIHSLLESRALFRRTSGNSARFPQRALDHLAY